MQNKILVIGAGYIAQHIARLKTAEDFFVTLCSRNPIEDKLINWEFLDATDIIQVRRKIRVIEPNVVILVHGPSDIAWCESNPNEALGQHLLITYNVCSEISLDVHVVLVSTDNVFDGKKDSFCEQDLPIPKNNYGLAKLECELIVGRRNKSTILRTSLVYGLNEPLRSWRNFFLKSCESIKNNKLMEIPSDLWMTPIWVEDVAKTIYKVIRKQCFGIFHLMGPTKISRLEWFLLIANELGEPKAKFTLVDSSETRYACRPKNSCLHHYPTNDAFSSLIGDVGCVRQVSRYLINNMIGEGTHESGK
ncbi:MAG: SDR family oxidoreductase [Formosimonas sp.]